MQSTPSEAVQYYFRSTFIQTMLVCDCRPGSATFRSDSITTISIIKEVLGSRTCVLSFLSCGTDVGDYKGCHLAKDSTLDGFHYQRP